MRKFMFFATALIFTCTMSSFSGATNNGNGNVITIDNGVSYVWRADNCDADLVPSTSARQQSSYNGFFSVDVTFQLPEGHCDIPERGATVVHYDSDNWAIINSKGFVKAKVIINPN
jgi:hypothetical protein